MKRFSKELNKCIYSEGQPLKSNDDNVLLYKLGRIAEETMDKNQKVGDYIDRGLILLRLLDEHDFEVIERQE